MKRKRELAALGLALVLGVTGCAGREAVHEDALEEAGIQESEWEREEPVSASGKEPEDEALVDVKDAKKISVKFTEGMKVEHWTIQGGGAGIDMQDAAVSDLQESMTVELEGYYDGEVFMATKVIMEEDV